MPVRRPTLRRKKQSRRGKRRTQHHTSKRVHGKKPMKKTRVHKRKHSTRKPRRTHKRSQRRVYRMRGGNPLVVNDQVDYKAFNDTVPFKHGTGAPAGEVVNGQNHYALAPTSIHEPNNTAMNTSLYTSIPQSGGGVIPQDLINLGRSVISNATGVYDSWRGNHSLPSGSVTVQPISRNIPLDATPMDVNTIELSANNGAAKL